MNTEAASSYNYDLFVTRPLQLLFYPEVLIIYSLKKAVVWCNRGSIFEFSNSAFREIDITYYFFFFKKDKSAMLRWYSWTHQVVDRMWPSRAWLKCLLLYHKMKVICLPVSVVHCVNICTSVSTGSQGKTQARRDTGTSRSILKSSNPLPTSQFVFITEAKRHRWKTRERTNNTKDFTSRGM